MDLISPLPLAESLSRMRRELDSPWSRSPGLPLTGRLRANLLVARKTDNLVRNPFRPLLRARFFEDGGETRISYRFGPHWFAVAFMTLWFTPFVIEILSDFRTLLMAPRAFHDWTNLLSLLGFLAFGLGLIAFGIHISRGDKAFMLDRLKQTLHAQ